MSSGNSFQAQVLKFVSTVSQKRGGTREVARADLVLVSGETYCRNRQTFAVTSMQQRGSSVGRYTYSAKWPTGSEPYVHRLVFPTVWGLRGFDPGLPVSSSVVVVSFSSHAMTLGEGSKNHSSPGLLF